MENLHQYLSARHLKISRLFLLISLIGIPLFAEDNNSTYIVRTGDTLWSISSELEITIAELLELNSFKTFKSGAPNIQINQFIKTSRTADDDIGDYCYSEYTFNGVNFSKTLKKSDLIIACTKNLMSSLDPYVIGDLDSWHMTEEEAQIAGEEKGIRLSWEGSKNIRIDDKFWEIYFSDPRYSYYFYNLHFANTQTVNASTVMMQAALKGDAIAADFIIEYGGYFFRIFSDEYEDGKEIDYPKYQEFIKNIISNLDPLIAEFYQINEFPHWYKEEFMAKSETPIQYKKLPNRYKAAYLLKEIQLTFKRGDLKFFEYRNEVLKFIQNSNSKLLTWDELALVVNLMYMSLNLSDNGFGSEISSIMEDRLDLDDDSEDREFTIYNRFIQNLDFESEYFNGHSLVLTWILNLTSSLDELYPEDYESFIKRRTYLLKFIIEAHDNQYISDSNLAAWNSDTGSKILSKDVACELAEKFYIPAFSFYEQDLLNRAALLQEPSVEPIFDHKVYSTDSFDEPLELARCFLNEKNLVKSRLYLDSASDNLKNYAYDKTFYQAHISIAKAKQSIHENNLKRAMQYFKNGSEYIFKNEMKLSHTLDENEIAQFINDYIEVFSALDAQNFNMSSFKSYPELEAFKNRVLSNRRLEQLKIDNNKANIQSLKSDLQSNKAEISEYEELLETNFEEKYLTKIDRLFKSRKKIISKMLSKNKEIDSLFNPSYVNYQKIASSIDDQSIMLSYNLATDSGKLIAQTASETFVFDINDGINLIQSNISALRSSMILGSAFNFEAAHNLYETLLKPLEPLLSDIKNIYLYGSDLQDLPFGVLLSNYNELDDLSSDYEKLLQSQWLIKSYSFARIFPLSNNKLNYEYDHKFLGLANPDSFQILGLSELPNAEEEIRQIALASKSYSQDSLLTNSNASKENLRARLVESYERVVFSTHSLPPNWNGITSESSLVLSDKAGDYLLTATEIVNMDFKSDMVVLSSCNTEKKGSDSLYKAFLVAGSNSVMYSNWDLETLSAAKITDAVFKSMLFDDAPKHIALQNASIKLMNDYSNRDYAHPGFWGNFSIAYRNL